MITIAHWITDVHHIYFTAAGDRFDSITTVGHQLPWKALSYFFRCVNSLQLVTDLSRFSWTHPVQKKSTSDKGEKENKQERYHSSGLIVWKIMAVLKLATKNWKFSLHSWINTSLKTSFRISPGDIKFDCSTRQDFLEIKTNIVFFFRFHLIKKLLTTKTGWSIVLSKTRFVFLFF